LESSSNGLGILPICFAGALIGLGLLFLFARDLMWEWTERSNSRKGVVSERTEGWETGQTIGGILFILIGAGFLCFSISQVGEESEKRNRSEAVITQIAATNTAQASLLASTFGGYLSQWQSDDSPGVHDAHLSSIARNIYYGRCESGYFYVYIEDYPRDSIFDYAYVPDSSPESCHPGGLQFSFFHEARSLGAGWYDIAIDSERNEIITPTPSPTRSTATPNPTQIQKTLDAAIEQQVTAAAADQNIAVTQTIAAAVQQTLTAIAQPATP
jgi:hypothetical protein